MADPLDQDTIREHVTGLPDGRVRGPRTRAVFTVLSGEGRGQIYTMDGPVFVIGRAPDVDIAMLDDGLSRRHARVRRFGGMLCIEDLGSTNGTFVDGQPVRSQTRLTDGARIQLGKRAMLLFRLHDAVEHEMLCETHARTLLDPLTGIHNRAHLQQRLTWETARARQQDAPLSLLLLDIDHFKRINDTFGHAAGDEALRHVASWLAGAIREGDTVARFGGEEFAIVARGMDAQRAHRMGERIRELVAERAVPVADGALQLTVSVGVAHRAPGARTTSEALIEAADRALYASKAAGRNRVSSAPPPD